jgi:hypothetical protein
VSTVSLELPGFFAQDLDGQVDGLQMGAQALEAVFVQKILVEVAGEE